jgi:photosystem II stability/assembly factor-like uncharacterized protein
LWSAGGRAGQLDGGWQATSLTEPVRDLFTPTSGALFALGPTALWRSDDGAVTWRAVPLPPAPPAPVAPLVGRRHAAIDPTNHTVLFVDGADELYRTTDDAAAWQVVLSTRERVRGLAISAADPRLIFLDLADDLGYRTRLLRSHDRGTSWDEIEVVSGDPRGCYATLFALPGNDPAVVLRSPQCGGGRTVLGFLGRSDDQGAHWTEVLRLSAVFPERLAGGQGPDPRRWYLGARRDARAGGGALMLRSDDGGATWDEVFATSAAFGGIAYDPSQPARVYVALNGDESGVQVSVDGGLSWEPIGQGSLEQVRDLAVGIDGANLYAATDHGVWRLPLGGPLPPAQAAR